MLYLVFLSDEKLKVFLFHLLLFTLRDGSDSDVHVVAGPTDHLLRAARARVALPLQGLRAALSLQDRALRPP